MKKLNAKRLAALAMTLVMLLGVLTACGDKADTNNGSGDGEGFPTMTIQIAHVNPTTDDDQYNKLATLFAEKVTAATDGAVTFEICGNSELGGEADVLTGFDLGKGMVNKIRALYPSANITPIDASPIGSDP